MTYITSFPFFINWHLQTQLQEDHQPGAVPAYPGPAAERAGDVPRDLRPLSRHLPLQHSQQRAGPLPALQEGFQRWARVRQDALHHLPHLWTRRARNRHRNYR